MKLPTLQCFQHSQLFGAFSQREKIQVIMSDHLSNHLQNVPNSYPVLA